ncbi:hypothetical protein NQ317_006519 [Molorchus minor]|uniref:Uncharacterized protein n=1 Tax=Molorchus minor TaxID=1323400 RepID=A0ABQ9IVT2_9CUCU|nr:hypothetical protein NQ317_006519 [Molorchus minor]
MKNLKCTYKRTGQFYVPRTACFRPTIRTRCAELTVLLDRGNILELHSFFPVLIINIFGPQGTVSWGLRTTTEVNFEDFRQLHHFLSPCGPLFKLIYTLLKDQNIRYDFHSHTYLQKLDNFLEQSQQHPFFRINPFDYYMFHFAYHLINPWQQRGVSSNILEYCVLLSLL